MELWSDQGHVPTPSRFKLRAPPPQPCRRADHAPWEAVQARCTLGKGARRVLRRRKGGHAETKFEKSAIEGPRHRPGKVTDIGCMTLCSLEKQNKWDVCVYRERLF